MIRRGVISVQVEVVADKRGIPVLRNNAFYLRLASARTLKDAQNKLKTLSSASSSKLTKQTSRNRSGELKILSERLPNGRTQYFVGQGPFTRYRDAQHALSKARARHTEASVACLPTLVAENTRPPQAPFRMPGTRHSSGLHTAPFGTTSPVFHGSLFVRPVGLWPKSSLIS